ncbi:MAG: LacI family transcriptional regulator, partial [Armatimonadetes bacterium]|nr:LacI family transcriptional regulator [Armatimonadota bacterium]
MITIRDIAADTGLSVTTVSLVLSGKAAARGIAPETRARVREAASRLGYRYNGSARALRTGRTNLIGVAGVSLEHPIHLMAMQAAARAVLAHRYSLALNSLDWQPQQPVRMQDDLVSRRVEGILVIASRGLRSTGGLQALQRLADGGLPIVTFVDWGLQGVDVVTVDREAG